MSRLISCMLALLALPQIAAADVGTGSGAGQIGAEAEPALEHRGVRVEDIPPVLDLRIRTVSCRPVRNG